MPQVVLLLLLLLLCRHHEAMSCRLLQAVLGEAQLDLDSSQVAHVQDMIDNSTHSSLRQPMHPAQAWRLQVRGGWVRGWLQGAGAHDAAAADAAIGWCP